MDCPSSSSVSDPAVEIPNIPEELIIEILSRLPVKPLLRFRLKFNLKLCPLHAAIYQHDDDAPATQVTIMGDDFLVNSLGNNHDFNREIVMADFDDGYDHKVFLLGSCNGLFCVYVFGDIFLWNPSIRKSKKLPDFGPKSGTAAAMLYGFGYDESNDDYKVYRILGSNQTWVDAYSQNTNSGRRIEDFNGVLINQGVYFVSGKLHWSVGGTGGKIVTLDLTDGMYGEVEQPKYGEHHVGWNLEVLGGCLAVFYYHQNGHVDLWIMQEYGVKESWTKMVLMINYPYSSFQMFQKPVFLLKDGEILFQFGDGLVLYHPKRKSCTYPRIANVKALL
ncbi:F-box/kelch-repeat protein At3g23880-like [Coffea eugenioides]|uniref:F-box/kelch-repeat protein At3g23880-like n=1 Tax=Coffea eugenioides TaxID=49369 RepID=UPI000F60FDF3|nr:F-box/kelch-repeat protein At3g23880-like [Coffea eugenioides]